MKTKLFIQTLFICVILMVPTNVFAQTGGGIDPGDKPHLTPPIQVFSVFYDEETCLVTIRFNRAVEDALISIYKDDVLVDSENLPTVLSGTTFTFILTQSGLYTAYIKIGEAEYMVFEEDLE